MEVDWPHVFEKDEDTWYPDKAEKPAMSGWEYLRFMKPALFVFKLAVILW